MKDKKILLQKYIRLLQKYIEKYRNGYIIAKIIVIFYLMIKFAIVKYIGFTLLLLITLFILDVYLSKSYKKLKTYITNIPLYFLLLFIGIVY